MKRRPFLIAFVFALVLAAAVVGGLTISQKLVSQPRVEDALGSITDRVIVPGFSALAAQSVDLVEATKKFCALPRSTDKPASKQSLGDVRQAWRNVYLGWKQMEPAAFGPSRRLRLVSRIDFWPLRRWAVDEEINKTGPFEQSAVQRLGAGALGLPVIEYLIYSETSKSSLTNAQPRTCQYLVALSQDVAHSTRRLRDAWTTESSGFDQMVAAVLGEDSSVTTSQGQELLGIVVNQMLSVLTEIEESKLGRPMGLRSGNMKQPESVEAYYSGDGLLAIRANLEGMMQLHGCATEDCYGIGSLIKARAPGLNERVNEAADQLRTALQSAGKVDPKVVDSSANSKDDFDGGESEENEAADPIELWRSLAANGGRLVMPLQDLVMQEPANKATAVFEAVQNLRRLFFTEYVAALGVTPTLSDNDGD